MFDGITNKLAAVFKVNTDKQRIDSVHIKSNMRRLGRIGIFFKSIHKFFVNLKRGYKEQFERVDKAIIDKYLSEKALGLLFDGQAIGIQKDVGFSGRRSF